MLEVAKTWSQNWLAKSQYMLTEAMKIGKCYIPETGFENERKIEYIFWEMWSFFHGLFFKILFEKSC